MSKLKTHRGAKKRFKTTKSGRIKHRCANRNHILTKKPAKRKRHLRALGMLKKCDEASVNQMLGSS